MLKTLLTSGFVALASQASAQSCPDFFRFVEFGLQDSAGRFLRGGPIFRGESLEGHSLLDRAGTQCRAVRDIGRDGHGNPIPVVSTLAYDVGTLEVELIQLHISYVEDIQAVADENAAQHRQNLAGAVPLKGQNALCVVSQDEMSCQVVSPYLTDVDLVIYCDLMKCRMPVLAALSNIQISAEWAVDSLFWADPERAGDVIFQKVQDIRAVLVPLTSSL